ncbi:uncharacterized protein [Labrus bergylta]|uniref:Uncharacterized LOC109997167 n=1 Tax=Labrus bergylta TaxID=56723 RepID=A0A3Q3EUP3_9LABR|nr:uncharacterized protein LOC109997167 isoform X2 [Labrus bergylta]
MNTMEKKLADLIRDHPNLYDQSRRDYKDNHKGHFSWKEIAGSMGKSEEEVKLKWKNLRDKFCKAKKRMVKRSFPPLTGEENPVERPAPALYHQLAWLSAYVKPRGGAGMGETDEGAGSGDDQEKELEVKDEKEQHGPLPVVSTSFSLTEPCQNSDQEMGVSLNRKRRATTETTETNSAEALASLKDEDELFLLSLLPSLKRLTIKKRMEVRMKFQQILYSAEFED